MDLQKIYTDSDFSSAVVPDGQILLFSAIENGKPVTRYKDSNGNFGTLSGGGGGESGGSADYYKCAAVYGPRKVSCIVVSGAGTSDVNGRYFLSDMVVGGVDEIYKNENNDFYMYRQNSQWYIAYTMSATYAHYESYDFVTWGTSYEGEEPPPTVAKEQVTIDADVPKTWDGYKAVWSDKEGYAFEETVTEGLTYGSAFVPNPGGIYNASVTAIVEALYQHTSQRSVLTLSSNNWASSGTFKQDDGTDYGQRSCVWRSQSDTERLIVWGAPTVDDDRGDSEHAGVEGWHIVMASDTNIHIWWLGDKTYPQSYSNVTVSESFENWTV